MCTEAHLLFSIFENTQNSHAKVPIVSTCFGKVFGIYQKCSTLCNPCHINTSIQVNDNRFYEANATYSKLNLQHCSPRSPREQRTHTHTNTQAHKPRPAPDSKGRHCTALNWLPGQNRLTAGPLHIFSQLRGTT